MFLNLNLLKNNKATSKSQDRLLPTMIRVMMENEDNVVYELLQVLSAAFGECCLSIIKVADRTVVFTTEEKALHDEMVHMAQSIKDVCKNRYYLINQKNNVWFREGYYCIRTIPLMYANRTKYVLVVEQEENITMEMDRAIGLLAIAVHVQMMEKEIVESYYVDSMTGLPNRDSLIRFLENPKELTFVGMFYLRNAKEILFNSNYEGLDKVVRTAVGIIGEVYQGMLFRISEDKLAVCMGLDLFSSVSSMQNCIDKLVQVLPESVFSASIISVKVSNELYKILYACEKACTEASKDTVTVIRSIENMDDSAREEDVYVSGTYKEKDVVDVTVEEVKADEMQGVVNKENGAVEEAEEELEFFYNIPDEDSVLA